MMHAVGKVFPRGDRAPAIEPVAEVRLRHRLQGELATGEAWRLERSERVGCGFYTSQALEVVRA